MKNKKIIITILFTIIVLITISVPMIVGAVKNQEWRELESDNSKISQNNIITNASKSGSGIPLINEATYKKDQNINTNDSNVVVESELTPEDKAMYEKWAKENEVSLKKSLMVEDLLNKYYEDDYKRIQSIMPDRSNGSIEITLTEYDVERAELIVKIYNEQKLNKEEKEACEHELNVVYKTPYNEIQLSDTLKKDIEKIIK